MSTDKLPSGKYKFRIRSQLFISRDNSISHKYIIEAMVGGHWRVFSDDYGIMKYATHAGAIAVCDELKKRLEGGAS
jgi:hypothetical protein